MGVCSCTGGDADRSASSVTLSVEVLVVAGFESAGSAGAGLRKSTAEGLRGICSLALPSLTVGARPDSEE